MVFSTYPQGAPDLLPHRCFTGIYRCIQATPRKLMTGKALKANAASVSAQIRFRFSANPLPFQRKPATISAQDVIFRFLFFHILVNLGL